MRNKITNFLTALALAAGMITASATSASVATVPQGMISFKIASGSTNYLSLPLTNTETYSSTVNTVTSGTITVSDAPAPFTTSLSTPSAPYFVKFLSGNEAGRVMLITSNTTSSLTLDTTDHATGQPVALDTANFNVAPGDAFEIFPGDTLASIFGDNSAQRPLLLTPGASVVSADTIFMFTTVNGRAAAYYFDSNQNCWMQYGVAGDASNTIIYPYCALAINVRSGHSDVTLVVTGRVTAVAAQTKLQSGGTVYSSTHFATDVKLSDLKFGANWVQGASVVSADTIAVWNGNANRFDAYFQKPDSTWHKFPDDGTDQSNVTIATGSVTAIQKRESVTGAATFLQSPLPYTLE
jgi:uncharacterized protein (TIGR02597 family)